MFAFYNPWPPIPSRIYNGCLQQPPDLPVLSPWQQPEHPWFIDTQPDHHLSCLLCSTGEPKVRMTWGGGGGGVATPGAPGEWWCLLFSTAEPCTPTPAAEPAVVAKLSSKRQIQLNLNGVSLIFGSSQPPATPTHPG